MERLTDIKEVESTRKQVEHALKSVGYKDIPLMRYVKLGEYENLGLEPQQIKEISNLYAEKCKEVAELKAELAKYEETNGECEFCGEYGTDECQFKGKVDASMQGRLVELPCIVGDMVYIIATCKDFPSKLDGTMYDSEGGFGTATGYYCPYEENCPHGENDCSGVESKLTVFEDIVAHVCIEEDKIWYVCENSNGWELKDFSKKIFLTREEAEKVLEESEGNR